MLEVQIVSGQMEIMVVDYFQFIDAVGQNTPDNQQLIADALSLIDDKSNPNGIAAGLVLASNILGVNENVLTGIGNAFQAIRTGNIPRFSFCCQVVLHHLIQEF